MGRIVRSGPGAFLPAIMLLLALVVWPQAAHAQSGSWAVTTGGLWSDSANWTGGTVADGQGSTATFNQALAATATVDLDSPRTIGNLSFTSVSNRLWLIDDNNNPANVLTLSRSDVTAPTITVNASTRAEIATVIAGTGGLTKAGGTDGTNPGVLRLSAANTYSGTTTVSGGILRIANDAALGTSSVNVTGGGLQLTNGVTVTGRSITVSSAGNNSDGGLAMGETGTGVWAGTVTTSGGGRIGVASGVAGGTLEISGKVTGASVNISAYGTVILSAPAGTNDYSTQTNILRGTLALGAADTLPTTTILDVHQGAATGFSQEAILDLNGFSQQIGRLQNTGNLYGQATVTNSSATAGTLTVNQSTPTTYSGRITGGMSLVKSGTGNLTLAPTLIVNPGASATQENTANTFTGTTRINAGTLTLSAHSGTDSQALSQSTYDTDSAGTLSFGTMTSAGFGALSGSGGLVLENASAAAVTLSLGGGDTTSSYAAGNLSGAGGLAKVGTGTLMLSGTNTYSGNTAVSAGTLRIASTNALPGFDTAGRYSVADGATLLVGDAIDNATVATMLGTGNFAANGRIGFDTSAGDRTYSDPITGSVGVFKTGGNTLSLTGSNTLGGIRVMGGTLAFQATANLAGTGQVILNNSAVQFNGGSSNGNVSNRTIVLEGPGRIQADANQFTLSAIQGPGQLTLGPGSALFVLNSTGTYAGGTVIEAGASMAVAQNTAFGTGPIRFEGGGLRSTQGSARTLANSVTLAGNVTFLSSGANVDRDVTFTGPVAIEGGSRTITVNTSPFAGETGIFLNGVVGDAGNTLGLTKAGPGTLVLGGANTYGGATAISAGTLRLTNAAAVGGSSGLSIASGASLDLAALGSGLTLLTGQSLGGAGSILGDLVFGSGSKLVFSTTDTLAMSGGTASFFAGTPGSQFGIDDLIGISSSTPTGTYTLISGTVDTTNLDNLGSANAYDLGAGVSAYFMQGSLQVIVVPEPESMTAVAAGLAAVAAWLRRRRSGVCRVST